MSPAETMPDSEINMMMSPAIMKMEPNPVESKSEENIKNTKNKKPAEKNERKGKKPLELQPHLEQQIRISQLIDNNNKEDPKLKEKLKKIVEATQKSLDDAYTALHDCDYDINRAVNKLLEEDYSEWSILSKKKRSKETKEEPEKEIEEKTTVVADSNDPPINRSVSRGAQRGGSARGRGRGGRMMRREPQGSPGRRVFTNSTLEARTQELLEAARARTPNIRPVDHWDPNRPVSDLLNRGARNDFEDEEYSGPLNRGLVFTSSSFGRQQHLDRGDLKKPFKTSSRSASPKNVYAREAMPSDRVKPEDDKTSSKDETTKNAEVEFSNEVESHLSPAQSNENTFPKPNLVMRAPPMTASVMKAPPRLDKPPPLNRRPRSSSIPARPKPSTVSVKKPITPVEMPPDSDSSMELLDVTFGAVDLEDNTYEVITKSDSSSELLFGNKPEDIKSDFENIKERSSVDNLRFVKDLKMESSFYESPVRQTAYPKTTQKSKSSNSFSNTSLPIEPSPPCVMSPPNISMSHPSSSALQSASLSHIPYFNSQANPPLSYYQNVISAPTYTTNSQYGTSGMSSSSYSMPYQSYSSMVQGHKPPVPSSQGYTSDLESMANHAVTSMNFTTPNFSIPVEAGKGGPQGAKSVPALVGHPQVVLGQAGVTYFQPPLYFPDVGMGRAGYYEYAAGSPPRTEYAVPPPEAYPDPAAAGQYPPPVCLPPTDTSRKPPPFQLPPSQLVFRGGKRVPSPSQVRSYN